MGTVRQLVDKLGTSDNVLAGNPKMTYMKDDYKKTNKFTNQIVTLQFPKNIYYGSEVTIDLYQEGDLVDAVWLALTYPSGQPSTVCDSFGTYVLNWVQLEQGNQVIERLHGEYIEIYNDLTVPQGKQSALSNLIGKNITSNLSVYYVKLSFSAFKYGFPVCALKENPRIRFNIRNFYECVTGATLNPLFNAVLLVNYIFLEEKERDYYTKTPLEYLLGQNQYFSVQCSVPVSQTSVQTFSLPLISLGTFCIFDFSMPKYVNKLVNATLVWTFTTGTTPANINGLTMYLNGTVISPLTSSITGTKTSVTYSITGNSLYTVANNTVSYTWSSATSANLQISGQYYGGKSSPYTVYTQFRGACKELFIVLQHTAAQPYDYTLNGNDLLAAMNIRLNTVEYLKAETGTPQFLRTIQGLDRHIRVPDRQFYMYSFCIDPENKQPTGSINMGMINNQEFDFYMNCSGAPINIRMYMRSYTTLKIHDGKLYMQNAVPLDTKGTLINTIKLPKINLQFTGTYTTSYYNDYTIVTFTSGTGLINVIDGGVVDIFLVGGGGGSGACIASFYTSFYSPTTGSFGGGGGGVLYVPSYNLVPGVYKVAVGAGGYAGRLLPAVNPNDGFTGISPGLNGGNSSVGTLVAYGGGGGGVTAFSVGASSGYCSGGYPGATGGSGGAGYNKAGSGIPGQGYAGSTSLVSGGGGGAGGSGDSNPLTGGPGIANSITGTLQYYGGGGGTATDKTLVAQPITGGIGGGGTGAQWKDTSPVSYTPGTAGTANTGGGGGGNSGYPNAGDGFRAHPGYAGGSGIVIIRYRNS